MADGENEFKSYAPVVGRIKSKRWVTNSNNYDGDEWGDKYYSSDEDETPAVPPIPELPDQLEETGPDASVVNEPLRLGTSAQKRQAIEESEDDTAKLSDELENSNEAPSTTSSSSWAHAQASNKSNESNHNTSLKPADESVIVQSAHSVERDSHDIGHTQEKPSDLPSAGATDTEGEYPDDIYGYYENDIEQETEPRSLVGNQPALNVPNVVVSQPIDSTVQSVEHGVKDLSLDPPNHAHTASHSRSASNSSSKPTSSQYNMGRGDIEEDEDENEEDEQPRTRGRWQPIPEPDLVPARTSESATERPTVPSIKTDLDASSSIETPPVSTTTPQARLTREILGTFGEPKPVEEPEPVEEPAPDPELMALYENSSQFLTRPISQYDYSSLIHSGTEPLSMHKSKSSIDTTHSAHSNLSSRDYETNTRPLSVVNPDPQGYSDSEDTPIVDEVEHSKLGSTSEAGEEYEEGDAHTPIPEDVSSIPIIPSITTTSASPEQDTRHRVATADVAAAAVAGVAGTVTAVSGNISKEAVAKNAPIAGSKVKKGSEYNQFDDFDSDYSYLQRDATDTRELEVDNPKSHVSEEKEHLDDSRQESDANSVASADSAGTTNTNGTAVRRYDDVSDDEVSVSPIVTDQPNRSVSDEDDVAVSPEAIDADAKDADEDAVNPSKTAEQDSKLPTVPNLNGPGEIKSVREDSPSMAAGKQTISEKLNRAPAFDFGATLSKPRTEDRISAFNAAADRELQWNSGLESWLSKGYAASRRGAGIYTGGKPPPPTQQEVRMAVPSRTMSTSFIRPAKHMSKEAFGKVGEKSKVARSLLFKGRKLIKTQPGKE